MRNPNRFFRDLSYNALERAMMFATPVAAALTPIITAPLVIDYADHPIIYSSATVLASFGGGVAGLIGGYMGAAFHNVRRQDKEREVKKKLHNGYDKLEKNLDISIHNSNK